MQAIQVSFASFTKNSSTLKNTCMRDTEKISNYKNRIFKHIIITLGTARDGDNGILDMSYHFQPIANRHGLTLWDLIQAEVKNLFTWSSHQTNYNLGLANKIHETQSVWVKFSWQVLNISVY